MARALEPSDISQLMQVVFLLHPFPGRPFSNSQFCIPFCIRIVETGFIISGKLLNLSFFQVFCVLQLPQGFAL